MVGFPSPASFSGIDNGERAGLGAAASVEDALTMIEPPPGLAQADRLFLAGVAYVG